MTSNTPQWRGDAQQFIDELFAWYEHVGASHYDEQVTQLAHALQTANHACQNGATDIEIGAALLHDVGHFLVRDIVQQGDFLKRDLEHEIAGAAWLSQFFPAEWAQLVRLHVPAKRWLCAMDQDYWNGLSDASKHSLEVQGGLIQPYEIAAFEAQEGWQAAVALRKYDDLGKERNGEAPGLESYRELLLGLLTAA